MSEVIYRMPRQIVNGLCVGQRKAVPEKYTGNIKPGEQLTVAHSIKMMCRSLYMLAAAFGQD